ncbi:NACHT and WD domain [Brachionus plicatilis]|uniref:NACHT and WD domain n=1 Tax=Brachionus plicatilis TaxID=10195 RepID=A0A3M7S633_BRAPC|nr:NACHT and WD domain [Brachionus plicatilis]
MGSYGSQEKSDKSSKKDNLLGINYMGLYGWTLNGEGPDQKLKWKDQEKSSYNLNASEKVLFRVNSIDKVVYLQDHLHGITCMDFDKKRLVTGGKDRIIYVYDLKDGSKIGKLVGHKGGILCLQLLSNRLCSGSWDTTVIIWNMYTFQSVIKISVNLDSITSLYFDYQIWGGFDKTINVWSFVKGYSEKNETNSEIRIDQVVKFECLILHHKSSIKSLSYDGLGCIISADLSGVVLITAIDGTLIKELTAPKYAEPITCLRLVGALIITSTVSGRVIFWNRRSNTCETIIKCHDSAINSIAFYDQKFYTAGSDSYIKEWDLRTFTCLRRLKAHNNSVLDILVMENKIVTCDTHKNNFFIRVVKLKIVSLSIDLKGIVFRLSRKNLYTELMELLKLALEPIYSRKDRLPVFIFLILVPEIINTENTFVKIKQKQVHEIDLNCTRYLKCASKCIKHECSMIMIKDDYCTLFKECLWSSTLSENNQNYTQLKVCKTLNAHDDIINSLEVLPNGYLVSGSLDRTIKIWNLTDGTEHMKLENHTGKVSSLKLLPNGDLVSGSSDRTIKVWNLTDGTVKMTLTGHTDIITSLAILPYGDLASGSWDKTIKIWNLTDGTVKMSLDGHLDRVLSIEVLSKNYLVSGSSDNTIKIWSLKDAKVKMNLKGHSKSVSSLLVLRNGFLATGSGDSSIKLWDLTNGTLLTTLMNHTDRVSSLLNLQNGDLATGSWDNTIKIWNPTDGLIKMTFFNHTDRITSLINLPNGLIASVSYDRTIKIWC